MKNKLVGAVGVAVLAGAAYAGGCWYTGSQYDSNVAKQLELLNQQPGISAQWLPGQSALNARHGVLQITLAPEFFAQHGAADDAKSVELFFNVEQSVAPLYLRGEAVLDQTKGSIADVLQQLQLKAIPHQLRWSYNALTQSAVADMSVDGWKLDTPTAKVDFAKFQLHSQGKVGSQADVTFSWEGLKVSDDEHQELYLAPSKGQVQLSRVANAWVSPQNSFELQGLKFVSPDTSLTLDKLVSNGSIAEQGSQDTKLDMSYQTQIASLTVENPAYPFVIDNFALGLKLTGLDKASYLSLVEQTSQQHVDEAKAMAALEQLLKKGAGLTLSELSLNFNKASLQAKGNLDLAANDKLEMANIPSILGLLKGELELNAAKELVAMVPNGQQMLAPMMSAGYIKQGADGKLSVQLKLADRKATANGLPLPL
ncbi:MAG: DUF945 family protein [Aeromonadaceae bacterium]